MYLIIFGIALFILATVTLTSIFYSISASSTLFSLRFSKSFVWMRPFSVFYFWLTPQRGLGPINCSLAPCLICLVISSFHSATSPCPSTYISFNLLFLTSTYEAVCHSKSNLDLKLCLLSAINIVWLYKHIRWFALSLSTKTFTSCVNC